MSSLRKGTSYMVALGCMFAIASHEIEAAPSKTSSKAVDTSVLPKGVERVAIFLLMGQSNMKGRGKIPAKQTPHPRIVHMNMANDQWYPAKHPRHKAGEPDLLDGSDNSGVGPGLGFAREPVKRDKEVLVTLVSAARGGSGMDLWKPKAKLYKAAIKKAEKALSYSPESSAQIAGTPWLQGSPTHARISFPAMSRSSIR